MPATIALLERDDELAAIGRALDSAVAGDGGLLTIEGEAGIGKTSLLDAAAELAAERGMAVLRASGGEHERDFPYGVVRQLFDAPLATAGGDALLTGAAALAAPVFEAVADAGGDPFGMQHGLYWLTADLAERRPLAIVVDDVQWADLASLRSLAHIVHRVADLPLLLAIGIRVGEPDVDEALLDELRREARRGWLRPRPLGGDAVESLVTRELGADPDLPFVEACQHASAGNPFLVVETVRTLAAEGIAPLAGEAGRVQGVAAAGAARSILLRVFRLGDDAVAVARAVAVLEPNAGSRQVAALAGLAPEAVTTASERLVAARLLDNSTPLAFVHPLVRAAVYEDVPHPRRAAMHDRAARLLAAADAPSDAVAGHLLLAEPAGEPWVAAALRAAARSALGRGAPESAVRYLRRALAEPPPVAERGAALVELGSAQLRAGDGEGVETLARARAESRDLVADPAMTMELAISLAMRGRFEQAMAVLEESLAAIGDRDGRAARDLRATMLLGPVDGMEGIPVGAMPGAGESLDASDSSSRLLFEGAAFLLASGTGSLREAGAIGRRLLADSAAPLAAAHAGFPPHRLWVVMTLADEAAAVEALYEPVLAATRGRGVVTGVATGLGARAFCRFVDGDLGPAEVDARTAIAVVDRRGIVPSAYWMAVLINVLVERGELAAADRLRPPDDELVPGFPGAMLLCARARLRFSLGRHHEARSDFLAAAERVEWVPHVNPEAVGWRLGLAHVESVLGNHDEAARLTAETIESAAATENPRALGMALRTQGRLAATPGGVEPLREAAEILAGTNARLRHAHTLVDLGAALRRANHRRDARKPLREGLDLAHRCGATALEDRARTELAATGARPRSATLTGVESLTPSELRVARMAADGLTNREIAQQLYVTAKTVETHLRHAFQKLDVDKRTRLAAKL